MDTAVSFKSAFSLTGKAQWLSIKKFVTDPRVDHDIFCDLARLVPKQHVESAKVGLLETAGGFT